MNRPLIIYLDSSDYSRFADVHRGNGTTESEQTLRAVSQLVRNGDIQIPFSGLHVMEAAARDVSAIDAATARLTIIGALAQGKAFRGWTELPAIDYFFLRSYNDEAKAIRPVDREIHNGRSTEGEWFPGLPSLMSEIGEIFETAYRNPVAAFTSDPDNKATLENLNRDQRRKLKKQSRKPIDPLTLRQMVDSDWPARFSALRANVPLPIDDSEIWRKFAIAPTHNVVQAFQSCRRGFADLSSLATYLIPGEETINQRLTSWLRESAASIVNLAEQMNELRARWASIRNDSFRMEQKRLVLADAKEFHKNWLEREHLDLLKELPNVYESYRLSGDKSIQMPDEPSRGVASKLASISNRALVFRSYREVVGNPLGAQRATAKHASDIGDIFHAQYLPYCDIYRCDGFASTYLKRAAGAARSQLVASLPKLVNAIEDGLRGTSRR